MPCVCIAAHAQPPAGAPGHACRQYYHPKWPSRIGGRASCSLLESMLRSTVCSISPLASNKGSFLKIKFRERERVFQSKVLRHPSRIIKTKHTKLDDDEGATVSGFSTLGPTRNYWPSILSQQNWCICSFAMNVMACKEQVAARWGEREEVG